MDISQFSYTELALFAVTTFTVVFVVRAYIQARREYKEAMRHHGQLHHNS